MEYWDSSTPTLQHSSTLGSGIFHGIGSSEAGQRAPRSELAGSGAGRLAWKGQRLSVQPCCNAPGIVAASALGA